MAFAKPLFTAYNYSLAMQQIGVAGSLAVEGDCVSHLRLAAASVAAVPLRLRAAEQHLLGRSLTASAIAGAAAVAATEITPIDDVRSTAAYRRFAVEQLVRRFLTRAAPV